MDVHVLLVDDPESENPIWFAAKEPAAVRGFRPVIRLQIAIQNLLASMPRFKSTELIRVFHVLPQRADVTNND